MYVAATQTAMGLFGVNSCNLKLHDIKLDSLDAQPKKQLLDLCIFCFVFFWFSCLDFSQLHQANTSARQSCNCW